MGDLCEFAQNLHRWDKLVDSDIWDELEKAHRCHQMDIDDQKDEQHKKEKP